MATPHEEASKEDVPMTLVDELEDFLDLDLNAEDVIGDLLVEEEEELGNQEENGEKEGLDDLGSNENFPEEFEKLQSTVAEQASSLLQQKRREFLSIHNVKPDARVIAATGALDEAARNTVYSTMKLAGETSATFRWSDFCSAMKNAFHVQKTDLEVRSRVKSMQCGTRNVQEYANEFERTMLLLTVALTENEAMSSFYEGLPQWLRKRLVLGRNQYTMYKELKTAVIDLDVSVRTWLNAAKGHLQSGGEGPSGQNNAVHPPNGKGPWKKRHFHPQSQKNGPRPKRPFHKGGQQRNGTPFCTYCKKMGHTKEQCRTLKRGKPQQANKKGDAGPSGSRQDFHKSN
ncbi:unnamed protein product [Closterium sp. NIES-53]